MRSGWRSAGGSPAEVTRRLARKTGRSPETIRYTLKQFDQDHPDLAIFPDNHGPLRLETKRKIYQQYHRGESVEALAKRFCRTRASIYRIIAEMRAQRICELPLDYIPNDQFAKVLRSAEAGAAGARADAGQRRAAEEVAAAQRPAPLLGQPVRGAAADPRPGSPSVPQDELPEIQGRQAARQARSGPAEEQPDGPDREALRRGRGHEEPDHPGEPAAGGLDRQAARRARRRTSSSWSATGTCR